MYCTPYAVPVPCWMPDYIMKAPPRFATGVLHDDRSSGLFCPGKKEKRISKETQYRLYFTLLSHLSITSRLCSFHLSYRHHYHPVLSSPHFCPVLWTMFMLRNGMFTNPTLNPSSPSSTCIISPILTSSPLRRPYSEQIPLWGYF